MIKGQKTMFGITECHILQCYIGLLYHHGSVVTNV